MNKRMSANKNTKEDGIRRKAGLISGALSLAVLSISFVLTLNALRQTSQYPVIEFEQAALKLNLEVPMLTGFVGELIQVEVRLLDFSNKRVPASKDLLLHLNDLPAEVFSPEPLVIPKGRNSLKFALRFREPGVQSVVVSSEDALLDSVTFGINKRPSKSNKTAIAPRPRTMPDRTSRAPDERSAFKSPHDISNRIRAGDRRHKTKWVARETSLRYKVQSIQSNPAPVNTTESELQVVPTLQFNPNRELRASHVDTATISISLKAKSGDQEWEFTDHEDLSFRVECNNKEVKSDIITIPRGHYLSPKLFTFSLNDPYDVHLTCVQVRKYEGLAIRALAPINIKFITPITGIRMTPESKDLQMNVSNPFLVSLFFKAEDSKGNIIEKNNLPPDHPVTITITSETSNGKIAQPEIVLTDQAFTKDVYYIGQNLGSDTINATGHYARQELKGKATRKISLAWLPILFGVFGAALGALVRVFIDYRSSPTASSPGFVPPAPRQKRLLAFFDRLFPNFIFGFAFSFILIVAPIGTVLPTGYYVQPVVVLVVAFILSCFGRDFVSLLISIFTRSPASPAAN